MKAKAFIALTKRNTKMFFKDKGMFFSSLVSPLILLILYATFLSDIYKDSFNASLLRAGVELPKKIIDGTVGAQLFSSLLAVSCVTVAFCSNLLMVQDIASETKKDFFVSPQDRRVYAFAYYFSSLITTLIITLTATSACFAYIAIVGWYMSVTDVLLVLSDVLLLTMFGVALSSVVNVFLRTNGQASAVGTIVSAAYGFICGAYMPLSSFDDGLRNALSCLPGTYGTALLRRHSMNGALREMGECGIPTEVIESIKDSVDCNIVCFGNRVDTWVMYTVFVGAIALLVVAYVIINKYRKGAYENK